VRTSDTGWPNQLAAGQQHQHRRDDGQAEQRGDQLQAEARERQAAAPLHDQLDDVAREHEAEREQHRHVGDRERVQQHLAHEVGIEARRAGRELDDRDQAEQQQDDAGENQARVVAKRAALRHDRPRRPARRQLRTIRRARGVHFGLLFCSSSISRWNSPTSRNWR
jgi:hypothetical protein